MPGPFSFETTTTISESDYMARSSLARPRSPRGRITLITATVLGVAALFSLKTAPFGGILLAISAFVWTSPRWSRLGVRSSYQARTYLHGPLTYGVSDQKLWFRGGHLYAESSWDGLAVWEESNGTLRLGAAGLPELYFSVADLQGAGVYVLIRERLGRYGVEFNSPAAKRRFSPSAPAT